MDKVDEVVKDTAKNLEVKNIIKLDAMQGDMVLAEYMNQKFYKSKDIYLNQVGDSCMPLIIRHIITWIILLWVFIISQLIKNIMD